MNTKDARILIACGVASAAMGLLSYFPSHPIPFTSGVFPVYLAVYGVLWLGSAAFARVFGKKPWLIGLIMGTGTALPILFDPASPFSGFVPKEYPLVWIYGLTGIGAVIGRYSGRRRWIQRNDGPWQRESQSRVGPTER